jgi:hypothetical protein
MARCECNQICSCFVLDDSYDGLIFSNNQSTFVEGIGLSNAPYIVRNIHDPEFIPPTVKVNYDASQFATDFPGGSGGGQIPSFASADFNTASMFNTNQPDRLSVIHGGVYTVGFDVTYELQFSGASSAFEYAAWIEHHRISDSTYEVVKHQYFETTTVWPLQVRSTQSRIVPYPCQPGDYFTLHVSWALKPLGIPAASMWICYT